jgi:uncharacterized protein (DUF433 family)
MITSTAGGGAPTDELLTEYPHLTRENVLAAIAYGARSHAGESTPTEPELSLDGGQRTWLIP